MRVSVVATGIDAAVSRADVPLPRRSMAQPLNQRVSAEEPRAVQQAPRQAPQPAPQSAMAARQSAPAQQVPPRAAAPSAGFTDASSEDQPYDPRQFDDVGAGQGNEYGNAEAAMANDDLPAPAYRPREVMPAPAIEAYAPPRQASPSAPGTPTPEALARLRAMASRASEARAAEPRTSEPRYVDPRQNESRQLEATRPAQQPPSDRPRFGINSLINRMTGNGSAVEAQPAPQHRVSQEAQPDAEPDRADIPAFLRRQAN